MWPVKGVGRKISRETNEKRPKNSTIKPPREVNGKKDRKIAKKTPKKITLLSLVSTIVPCMKIHGGRGHCPPLPTPMWPVRIYYTCRNGR